MNEGRGVKSGVGSSILGNLEKLEVLNFAHYWLISLIKVYLEQRNYVHFETDVRIFATDGYCSQVSSCHIHDSHTLERGFGP